MKEANSFNGVEAGVKTLSFLLVFDQFLLLLEPGVSEPYFLL